MNNTVVLPVDKFVRSGIDIPFQLEEVFGKATKLRLLEICTDNVRYAAASTLGML